jgi:uncharacterized glyoxalase superfamily protein PhnB
LPAEDEYFTRHISGHRRGLGVELVLEVDDLDGYHARILASEYEISELLRERPWGLRDFRVVDPDGYYLRITSRA